MPLQSGALTRKRNSIKLRGFKTNLYNYFVAATTVIFPCTQQSSLYVAPLSERRRVESLKCLQCTINGARSLSQYSFTTLPEPHTTRSQYKLNLIPYFARTSFQIQLFLMCHRGTQLTCRLPPLFFFDCIPIRYFFSLYSGRDYLCLL